MNSISKNTTLEEFLGTLKKINTDPKYYGSERNQYCVEGYTIPRAFLKNVLKFHQNEIRNDDVILCSFPKTGTTWTQEILYFLTCDNSFDKTNMSKRFPFVEFPSTNFEEDVVKLESPRLLKTHLPLSLLPSSVFEKKCKIIYVARNPKDVLISYYHFAKNLTGTNFLRDVADYIEVFTTDLCTYAPYPKHVLEAWNRRNDGNILFLFYEDLKKELLKEIGKVAEFLGKTVSKEDIEKIAGLCSFQSMADKMSGTPSETSILKGDFKFMRKGIIGDWKNEFDEKMNEKVDIWIRNSFQDSDIKFTYE